MTEFEKAASCSDDSTREWGVSERVARFIRLVPSQGQFRVNRGTTQHIYDTIERAVGQDALSRLRSANEKLPAELTEK